MDREKLKQLYQNILKRVKKTPEESALHSAIQAYFKETERLWTPDKHGFLPLITVDDKEKLIKRYDAIAEALDRFIEQEEQYDPELVKAVNAFAKASSWNFNILWRYDPAQGLKSAETLAEENRELRLEAHKELETVDGGTKKIGTVGFRDATGHVKRGVFRQKTITGCPTANVKAGLKQLAEGITDPDCKKFVENILDRPEKELDDWFARQDTTFRTKKNFDSKDSAAVYCLLGYACPTGRTTSETYISINDDGDGYYEKTYEPRTVEAVAKGLAEMGGNRYTAEEIKKHIGEDALKKFAELLDKQTLPPSGKSAYDEGSSIDGRGIGVSVLADLFGVSDIVARTVPAALKKKDGKWMTGTLMFEAEGITRGGAKDLYDAIGPDCLNDRSGSLKRDIVNMAWLDYICFNDDRSRNNMAYWFEKDNTMIHLKGFDHDRTFTREAPTTSHNSVFTALDDIRFISSSMAQRILEMGPKRLKFALWCSGITKNERDAAADRLAAAKRTILKSRGLYQYESDQNLYESAIPNIREVFDDQFHNVDLYPEGYRPTGIYDVLAEVFGLDGGYVKSDVNLYVQQKECKLPVEEIIGDDNRATAEGLKVSTTQLQKHVALLNENTKKRWPFKSFRTSPNYEAMRQALGNLLRAQQELSLRLETARQNMGAQPTPDLDLQAVVTPIDLERLVELNRELEKSAWTYLYGKFGTDEELAKLKELNEKRKQTQSDTERKKLDRQLQVLEAKLRTGILRCIRNKEEPFVSYTTYTKGRIIAAREVVKLAQKDQGIGAEIRTSLFNTSRAREKLYWRCGIEKLRAAEQDAGLSGGPEARKNVTTMKTKREIHELKSDANNTSGLYLANAASQGANTTSQGANTTSQGANCIS